MDPKLPAPWLLLQVVSVILACVLGGFALGQVRRGRLGNGLLLLGLGSAGKWPVLQQQQSPANTSIDCLSWWCTTQLTMHAHPSASAPPMCRPCRT